MVLGRLFHLCKFLGMQVMRRGCIKRVVRWCKLRQYRMVHAQAKRHTAMTQPTIVLVVVCFCVVMMIAEFDAELPLPRFYGMRL